MLFGFFIFKLVTIHILKNNNKKHQINLKSAAKGFCLKVRIKGYFTILNRTVQSPYRLDALASNPGRVKEGTGSEVSILQG